MKQFPLFITALAAALLTGCATADFTPYVGEQQKWPTAKGAFVTMIIAMMDRDEAEQGSNTRFLFTSGHQIALTLCLARLM